jgi:hypothetical protein
MNQATPLKNFEGPSLLSVAKSILEMSVLRPFPPISIIPMSHSSRVCPLSVSTHLSKWGTLLVCPYSFNLHSFASLTSLCILIHFFVIQTKTHPEFPIPFLVSYTSPYPMGSLSINFTSLQSTHPEFLSL